MAATYDDIATLVRPFGLMPLGGFVGGGDALPDGTRSVVLLGPQGAAFWPVLSASPEYLDGTPDPVDRWSSRVLMDLASAVGGTALFPFMAFPPMPFVTWALRSGSAHISAVGLLVHAATGLWLSYRGALALPYDMALPEPLPNPCDTCSAKPCLAACPVGALSGETYDIFGCHAFLDTVAGIGCMENGCAVRASCPASQAFGRDPRQSAHHMKAFHP